ncbi:ABC transporter substrate-binding protein [Roseomonas elaeocarpi]|uniref:ABC transporter substrate-binding protein n=1 Tax=Roseomonas elaeocarpi TaxID=907779 RepID=A0ABV6JNQ7_9PROT
MNRRALLLGGAALAALPALRPAAAQAQTTAPSGGGTVRIAMTAADIPLTTGQPDQGMEGYRFTGYTIYDALVNWDLSRADVAPKLVPGLALSWETDPADRRHWIFRLRQGVRFHDGSLFDAAAVVWNLHKIYDEASPQFDARQAGQVRGRLPAIAGYDVLAPDTVRITTREVDAFFPFEVSYLLFSSPTRWEECGRDWGEVAKRPSGTGPFRVEQLVPRQSLALVRNAEYWDLKRIPKAERIVLLPTPDATARSNALMAGQVDWVEAPAPDILPGMKAGGMQVVTNLYPHIWPYEPSRLPGSPWNDLRVRKAVNLAIDRDGLTELLGGTMRPATGYVYEGHPWYGAPSFKIRHDPEEAKRLLREAGFGPDKKPVLRVAISTSGSGQMQPQPMNEFIQQNLAEVGIDLQFEVLEWETLRGRRRVGARAEVNRNIDAINNSYGPIDPATAFTRQFSSRKDPPDGFNWGSYRNPEVDALIEQATATFDPAAQDALLAKAHALLVDDAVYVFVAHDLNPRALSPKLRGYVQAQSWFPQLTDVHVGT